MFPWNFFNAGKNGSDPFKRVNEMGFETFMEKWMNQLFPDNFQSIFQQAGTMEKKEDNQSLHEQVFETHDDVFIRIPIDDEKKMKQIKIFYSINKCFIKGLNGEKNPYTIILPVTVKKKGAKAVYKDGILEIRIPKNIDWQYSEIDVDSY